MDEFMKINWMGPWKAEYESLPDEAFAEEIRENSYAFQLMDDTVTECECFSDIDFKEESEFVRKLKHCNKNPEKIKGLIQNKNILLKNDVGNRRPGEFKDVTFTKVSSLTLREMQWIQNMWREIKMGRILPQDAQNEYEVLSKRLETEQKLYQEEAYLVWLRNNFKRHLHTNEDVKKYVDDVWQERIARILRHPRMYRKVDNLPMVYNNSVDPENPITLVPGPVLTSEGSCRMELRIPSISTEKERYLTSNYETMKRLRPPSSENSPLVSCDLLAERLAQQRDADIVISSSGIKCLAENHSKNLNTTWFLPVTVRQYTTDSGAQKTIVFVDKKLPPCTLTYSQRLAWHAKIAAKFLLYKSLDKEQVWTRETSVGDKHEEGMEISDVDGISDGEWTCGSDSEAVVDSDMETSECPSYQKRNPALPKVYPRKKAATGISSVRNLPEVNLSSCSSPSTANRHINDAGLVKANSNFANYYQLWTLGKTNQNQLMKMPGFHPGNSTTGSHGGKNMLNVLIRTRYETGKLQKGKPKKHNKGNRNSTADKQYSRLAVKLEYQFDYGAEQISLSESLKNWTDLHIRPYYTLLALARINPLTGELIQVQESDQKCLASDVNAKHGVNVSESVTNTLFSVFNRLVTLAPGKYLLRHTFFDGMFTELYIATESGKFDIFSQYPNDVTQAVAMVQAPFVPLDGSIITPTRFFNNTIPLTFPVKEGKKRKNPQQQQQQWQPGHNKLSRSDYYAS